MYLFCFEHQLDVRKVMDKGPSYFNGVLLVTHELRQGELPDQVPLTQIPFWVQVHNLHFDYFNESVGMALGNFVGRFLNYDEKNDIEHPDAYMRIRVMLDVLPYKRSDWLSYMEVSRSHVHSGTNVFRLSALFVAS
ncbi:hypothetical protein LINGRAHAP2_LOCUS6812 [Linum grandiflorum]